MRLAKTKVGKVDDMKPMSKKRQSGAVLVVSLIILLVLTILGVNSMSSLVLEERMASHTRQSMVASQSAEVALRAAETWIAANINTPGNISQFWNGTLGLYSLRTPRLQPNFDIYDDALWSDANSVVVNIAGIDPAGAKTQLVAQNPRYLIEYLGRVGRDQRLDPNSPDPDIRDYAFRITAIGWGEDANARFLAQSTFRLSL